MAESPAHRLGQIIGTVLEYAVEELLEPFANTNGLYLDREGVRPARKGKKVTWEDSYGNSHDLDYVLEKGGDRNNRGVPVAFIESAWRSYTKHSRAKAQEIQGAVLPLVDTHRMVAPFTGVVIGGVFTEGAINQLQSLGFKILFFPVYQVVEAFQQGGVDVAFHEGTPLPELIAKVRALEDLSRDQWREIAQTLLAGSRESVQEFMDALASSVNRQVEAVHVLPLHGRSVFHETVEGAIEFVRGYRDAGVDPPLEKFDILVRFTNGNRIEGQFRDSESAIDFLELFYQPIEPVP